MTDTYKGIQWKGTNACIDLNCDCGVYSHYDGFFAYHIRCPACKQVYRLDVTFTPVREPVEGCEPVIGETAAEMDLS